MAVASGTYLRLESVPSLASQGISPNVTPTGPVNVSSNSALPPVQLPTHLRNIFPSPAGAAAGSSILGRSSLFLPSAQSKTQIQAEAWLGQIREMALSPRGLGLFLAGGATFQLGRSMIASQEFQMAASAFMNVPRFRMAAAGLTTLPLIMVGCGGEGWDSDAGSPDARRPDGSPDAMMPSDKDGDGYNSTIDCNDGNPNIHPLPLAGGLVTIDEETTICPGIYSGYNLVIAPGSSNFTVTGTGVTLDGDGSMMPAFQLNMVNQITLRGFTILNYPLGQAVILLNNANNNTFRDMTVEAPPNRYAFFLDNSDGNTLNMVTINSHSDVAVQVNASDMFTMTSSTVTGVPPFDGVPAFGLLTIDGGTGHRVENNMFTGGSQFGLELYNLTNSAVLTNRMMANAGSGIKTSSMRSTTLNGNIVTGNQGWGLEMVNASTMNTITNNNFTANTLGAVTTDASSIPNTFSGNMPPP